MKKAILLSLICALVLVFVASCGGPSGTYSNTFGQPAIFNGDRLTMQIKGTPREGYYEIEDGVLTWWPEIDEDGLEELGFPADYDTKVTYNFEYSNKSVKFDGWEYKK